MATKNPRVLFAYNIPPLTSAFTLSIPYGFEPIAVRETTGVFGGTYEFLALVDPRETRRERVRLVVTGIGEEFDYGRPPDRTSEDYMEWDLGNQLQFLGMMADRALWMRHPEEGE